MLVCTEKKSRYLIDLEQRAMSKSTSKIPICRYCTKIFIDYLCVSTREYLFFRLKPSSYTRYEGELPNQWRAGRTRQGGARPPAQLGTALSCRRMSNDSISIFPDNLPWTVSWPDPPRPPIFNSSSVKKSHSVYPELNIKFFLNGGLFGTNCSVPALAVPCDRGCRARNEHSRRLHNYGEWGELGPSPVWKHLLALSHLRHYKYTWKLVAYDAKIIRAWHCG